MAERKDFVDHPATEKEDNTIITCTMIIPMPMKEIKEYREFTKTEGEGEYEVNVLALDEGVTIPAKKTRVPENQKGLEQGE